MSFIINPLLKTDSYKLSHYKMYPEGMTNLYSNYTNRGSRIEGVEHAVTFGLQAWLKDLTEDWEKFFKAPKEQVVQEYKDAVSTFVSPGFSVKMVEDLHDLGYLPVEFRALREGTLSPMKVPTITIESTHKDFAWIVNYLETDLSANIWHPSTVATIAWDLRFQLDKWAEVTGGAPEATDFQLHDFSYRGQTSWQTAAASGAGHLLSSLGTDMVPAVPWVNYYYPGEDNGLIGASVPATEHSVMTAYGEEGELETFRRLLKQFPEGILSVVSDTWDYFSVLTKILPQLKDEIMARNGKLVIRPDCYDEETSVLTNTGWKLFKDLGEDDLVAQVHTDNTYEFVKPLKYVDEEYNGPMVKYKDHHGKVDLLVTPNHRMLWKHNTKGDIVKEAGEYVGTHWTNKMYRTASAYSSSINKLSPLDRFKIAFQADGSYPSGGGLTGIVGPELVDHHTYRFNFAKGRKTERLINICEEGEFDYSIHDEPSRKDQLTVYVKLPRNVEILKDFSWVDTSNLSKEWCEEFIEELSYWDATRRHDGRFKFDTTTEEVMDVVELIALSAGYGVLVSHSVDNREEHFSDVYTAHIMKDNLIGGQAIQRSFENYSGRIYCVTVPTGMLLVKRGRGTAVCGNSGDPADIVCGTSSLVGIDSAWDTTPEEKGSIQILWDIFGGTVNKAGFRELDEHIGLIYGDSITKSRINDINSRLAHKSFASTNWVAGVGSYTYQMNTRDTLGSAVKATEVEVNGERRNIQKNPKTDNGLKKSATGRLAVLPQMDGQLYLVEKATPEQEAQSFLEPVWRNGEFIRTQSFNDVRETLKRWTGILERAGKL